MGLRDFIENAKEAAFVIKNADFKSEEKFKPIFEQYSNIYDILKGTAFDVNTSAHYCNQALDFKKQLFDIYNASEKMQKFPSDTVCAFFNINAVFQIYDNGFYLGETDYQSGARHGHGTYYWYDSSIYEGEWINNQRHGTGKMFYAPNIPGITNEDANATYEGEWLNGNMHGYGKYTYTSDWGTSTFEGEWRNDKKNGKGKTVNYPITILSKEDEDFCLNHDFKEHEGEYENGIPDGHGKMIWFNGDVYIGDFYNMQIEGFGKLTYANGDIFEGEFSDCMKWGKGKMVYANGDIEDGDWENDTFLGVRQIKSVNVPSESNIDTAIKNNLASAQSDNGPVQKVLSKEERLQELIDLKNKGFIDEDEFKEMKKQIIFNL